MSTLTTLKISNTVTLDENDVEISAIRAQGSGGQKVNKVSVAIHLRFDISASSLPEFYKEKLLSLKDKRITKDGIVVIKVPTAPKPRTKQRRSSYPSGSTHQKCDCYSKKARTHQADKRLCKQTATLEKEAG